MVRLLLLGVTRINGRLWWRRTPREQPNHSGTYSGTLRRQNWFFLPFRSFFVPPAENGKIPKALHLQVFYWF